MIRISTWGAYWVSPYLWELRLRVKGPGLEPHRQSRINLSESCSAASKSNIIEFVSGDTGRLA